MNARLAAVNMAPNVVDNYYAFKSKGGPPVIPKTRLEVLRRVHFTEWTTEDVRTLSTFLP